MKIIYMGLVFWCKVLWKKATLLSPVFSRWTISGGFLDAMQNQGLTVPDRNICWYTTQELDDFRQSRDISFLKKFLERITPDCTAFICEDDFIAWLLWEELSLGNTLALKREKRIATHAPLSSSLQSTGFKTTSADHSFETTIALAACSAPQH